MPGLDWLWNRSHKRDDDNDTAGDSAAKQAASTAQGSWEKSLNATDWSHYTSPQTITACVITSAATLALVKLYKTYLRRIPTVDYLKPGLFRRRSLFGYVTRVGDGDNFHLFHTPGGRLAGWGLLPGRRVQELAKGKEKSKLKGETVHVRLAGIDAPELAHFGRPAQPYGQEALDWLKTYVLHRYVRVFPYSRDQYERVVCTAYRRRFWFFSTDVGYQMIKAGLATVYEAKIGSEYGGNEERYRAAQARAQRRTVGMWAQPGLIGRLMGQKQAMKETPRAFKSRMAENEKDAK